jgi:hypothetical protein
MNSFAMELLTMTPYTTRGMLGGMMGPMDPAVATRDAE